MPKQNLGSDVFTTRIILEILIVIIGLGTLAWLTINTILWETAQIFWIFGLMGLIGVLASFVIKGKTKSLFFDVPISGQPKLNLSRKWLYVFFLAAFVVTFFVLSSSNYNIAAPSFQVVDIGLTGDVLLSLFAAIMEDIFFFALVPGLIFSIVYTLGRSIGLSEGGSFILSLAMILILTPTVFMFYHLGVYGFANQAAMTFVFIFGVEMTVMMLILRDITYVHARHIGNNLGLLIFQQMSLQTFITTLTTNMFFWGFVGFIALLLVLRWRRG